MTSPTTTPAAAMRGGWAVPIGGALKADHEAVWRRLVELSGGPGARWVVLGTASNYPFRSAERAAAQLERRGAVVSVLPVSPLLDEPAVADAVRDQQLVDAVRTARGVFFTGGSQDRIVDSLAPAGVASPLLQAIRAMQATGGVVAGSSAGAAVMSTTMFRNAPDVLAVMKGRLRPGNEIGPGLGFVGPNLLVDQHFFRRGRLGRLLPLMQAAGYSLGLGVKENSAVAVQGDQIEVLGGKALIVDLDGADQQPQNGAYRLVGAHLTLLDAGDRMNLATRELTPAVHKLDGQRLDPAAPDYKPYHLLQPFYGDMFAPGVLPTLMGMLIDARFDEVRGLAFDPRRRGEGDLAELGWELRIYKAPGAVGWFSDALGPDDYTVHRLGLDVLPVRMAQPLYIPW